jgi:hypothetical protein
LPKSDLPFFNSITYNLTDMSVSNPNKLYIGTTCTVALSVLAIVWYFSVIHQPSGIYAPITEMDVPFDTISFRAENGVVLTYKTGSSVVIPADAIVDEDGNTVKGVVFAQYREFHSAWDIFRAGIPMGDLAADRALMSGGMFELSVQQNGTFLSMAKGKHAKVSLAVYRATDGYEVFTFDDNDNWQENGEPLLDSNFAKFDGLAGLQALPPKPINPEVGQGDVVIDLEADAYNNPDLQFFKNTRWRLVGEETPDFKDNLWAFSVIWDRMKIVKHDPSRNLYKLAMTQNRKDYKGQTIKRNYEVVVTPVLEGEDLEASLSKFRLALEQYDSVAVFVQQEKARLDAQADVLNVFEIEKFGVHNIDQLIHDGIMLAIKTDFDFKGEVNPYFSHVQVYFLNHDLNTVQSYGLIDWDKVYVQPGSNTTVIAVLSGSRVAIVDGKEFAKLPLRAYNESGETYKFKMRVVPQAQLMPVMGLTALR